MSAAKSGHLMRGNVSVISHIGQKEVNKKRLLLIGGGHSHLFVLEALRKQLPRWREVMEVTMISRDLHTPYSGMLPGLIAGHYRPSECFIDIAPLAKAAGVTLLQGSVDGIDPVANLVTAGSEWWPFDFISFDIGSSPSVSVPGAAEHAVPVKPIEQFMQGWRLLQSRIDLLERPIHLVVAGGGAGGVEVALAMAHRLANRRDRVKWSLVTSDSLLSAYPRAAARRMKGHLAAAGIALRTDSTITHIEQEKLGFADGSSAAFDVLVWATGPAPQAWIAGAGLALANDGFIAINHCLQSHSHPHVFAAGDIATDPGQRRPKAGVFAVRQGPVLAENLLRFALEEELAVYRPQNDYLSLLSTGDRHAIASWYGLVWEGDWVWRWKNAIDRRFMRRFSPLSL